MMVVSDHDSGVGRGLGCVCVCDGNKWFEMRNILNFFCFIGTLSC